MNVIYISTANSAFVSQAKGICDTRGILWPNTIKYNNSSYIRIDMSSMSVSVVKTAKLGKNAVEATSLGVLVETLNPVEQLPSGDDQTDPYFGLLVLI